MKHANGWYNHWRILLYLIILRLVLPPDWVVLGGVKAELDDF